MKIYRGAPALITLSFLAAGYTLAATKTAIPPDDSPRITQLLADAKAEAVELRHDAEVMETFTRSKHSVASHGSQITLIREHVNNTGKLLQQLQDAANAGAPWQQATIERIEPLLKELAANIETTIKYLNENNSRIHFSEFRDTIKANATLAGELESMIRNAVDYGETKDKFDRLSKELEANN